MSNYRIGHYYKKVYQVGISDEFTIIKLESIGNYGDLRGIVIDTNMKSRLGLIGHRFSISTPHTDATRIYEISESIALAHAL